MNELVWVMRGGGGGHLFKYEREKRRSITTLTPATDWTADFNTER